MALTKAELAENLFDKLGFSKRDAKETVEVFFEEIRKSLENGEQVKLSGFGNFDLREKINVQVEILKQVRIYLFPLVVLLRSVLGRN